MRDRMKAGGLNATVTPDFQRTWGPIKRPGRVVGRSAQPALHHRRKPGPQHPVARHPARSEGRRPRGPRLTDATSHPSPRPSHLPRVVAHRISPKAPPRRPQHREPIFTECSSRSVTDRPSTTPVMRACRKVTCRRRMRLRREVPVVDFSNRPLADGLYARRVVTWRCSGNSRAGAGGDPGPPGPDDRRLRAPRQRRHRPPRSSTPGTAGPTNPPALLRPGQAVPQGDPRPRGRELGLPRRSDRGLHLLPDRPPPHPGADDLSRCPLGYMGDILGGGFILALAGFSVALAAVGDRRPLRAARQQPGDDLRGPHRTVDPVHHLHRRPRSRPRTSPTSRRPPPARRSARPSARPTCWPPSPSSWWCSTTRAGSRSRPTPAPSSSG